MLLGMPSVEGSEGVRLTTCVILQDRTSKAVVRANGTTCERLCWKHFSSHGLQSITVIVNGGTRRAIWDAECGRQ